MNTYSCGPTSGIVAACLFVFAISFWNGNANAERGDDRGINCSRNGTSPRERINNCTAVMRSAAISAEARGDAYHNRAGEYFLEREFDRAIADYTEAIRLPTRTRLRLFYSYSGRAQAYSGKNDIESAIADYSEAIRVGGEREGKYNVSSLYDTYLSRGFLYRTKKDYSRSISDASDAIRSYELDNNKQYPLLYTYRGETYLEMKAYDLAIADFRTAANNSMLGTAYLQKGDFNLAIATYSEAIRADLDSPMDYLGRGKAQERLGELKKALIDFRTATTLWKGTDDSDQGKKEAIDSLRRIEQKLSGVPPKGVSAPTTRDIPTAKKDGNTKALNCNDPATITTTDDFYSCANKSDAKGGKSTSQAEPSPAPNQKAAALTEDPFITKAKAAVKARVSDPESARFQSVELRTAAGKAVACGIIIHKNSSTGKMDPYSFAFDGEQTYIKFVIAESTKKATGDIAQIVDAYFKENTAGYNRLCN